MEVSRSFIVWHLFVSPRPPQSASPQDITFRTMDDREAANIKFWETTVQLSLTFLLDEQLIWLMNQIIMSSSSPHCPTAFCLKTYWLFYICEVLFLFFPPQTMRLQCTHSCRWSWLISTGKHPAALYNMSSVLVLLVLCVDTALTAACVSFFCTR